MVKRVHNLCKRMHNRNQYIIKHEVKIISVSRHSRLFLTMFEYETNNPKFTLYIGLTNYSSKK